MPLEHATWMIPAVAEGIEHHKAILSIWDGLISFLIGKKSRIIMTGMPGAGKSVLFQHLTSDAYKMGYVPPPQPSFKSDTGQINEHHKRIQLVTIPGQSSGPRYKSIDDLEDNSTPVTGVIHTVANGFATTRGTDGALVLPALGIKTIDEYRAFQKARELEDLRDTSKLIVDLVRKYKEPVWMFVAASKCDLYTGSLGDAEAYYSPRGRGPFVDEVAKLTQIVGTMNFMWDAIPVCAALEDFEWGGNRISSALRPAQRDQLVLALLKKMDDACER